MVRVGGSPNNYFVDIAFAALVDNITEAEGLIENGEVYYDYGTDFSLAGTQRTFGN